MCSFLIGVFVGAIIATAFLCMFFSAGQADRELEAEMQKLNNE